MSQLALQNISLAFGDRDLLRDVHLLLHKSSRVGLVGANGCGKTTVLEIATGQRQPDNGTVQRSDGLRLGYLRQVNALNLDLTIMETALTGYSDLAEIEKNKQEAAEVLAQKKDPGRDEYYLQRIHEWEEQLAHSGWWEKEASAGKVLDGLGFPADAWNRPLSEFSGGWKMRALLAATLLSRPDIMLLDEPTNYLDLETTEWLFRFLKRFEGGFLLVSHDRDFLDRLTTTTAEIFQGRLRLYQGNYSQYEEARALELEQGRKLSIKVEKQAAKLESFIQRFRYKSSKAAQVQSRLKELEKLPDIAIPPHLKRIHLQIPPPPHSGKYMMHLEDVGKAYGTKKVFSSLNVSIESGEKIAVSGKNGAGKTTLLKILSGKDRHFSGNLRYGTGLKMGYFAQEFDDLKTDLTVWQTATERASNRTEQELLNVLGAFLFSGDDLQKKVSVLSGGERNRLVMATLLLGEHNLLVLDEPTNHLDMASKELLLEALDQWQGTVLFVSHDRFFLRTLAQRVIYLENGLCTDYPGNWEDWESVLDQRNLSAEDSRTAVKNTEETLSDSESLRRQNKESQSRIRRLQREEEKLMEKIASTETQQKILEESMSLPENYTDHQKLVSLKSKHEEYSQTLLALHEEWESVAAELESLNVLNR